MTKLEGSCHCEKVKYEITTQWLYPLMWCYCKICRKVNGGFISCNLKGMKEHLKIIEGEAFLKMYRAEDCKRYFCSECSSALYITDDRWPEHCWPNAASIDTPLPKMKEFVHIFAKDLPEWFEILHPGAQFQKYPGLGIEEWHEKFNLD